MKTASVARLKTRLSKYIRDVQKGEEVLVTSHDNPVARLVPLEKESGLVIIPATRPVSNFNKVAGVKLRHKIDPVAVLLEDRARR